MIVKVSFEELKQIAHAAYLNYKKLDEVSKGTDAALTKEEHRLMKLAGQIEFAEGWHWEVQVEGYKP
jgi:hypothetical protein